MSLNATEVVIREYHFDRGANSGDFATVTNGTGAVDTTTSIGAQLSVGASADRAGLHFGDNLVFDIDELLFFEALFAISDWDANAEAVVGMASAYNADPDAIARAAWFKVLGDRSLVVETDDGTTNIDDQPTGIVVPADQYMRAKIDFATGIQSIAPPGVSKGGKSSLKFTCSDENGYTKHLPFNQHMDISAYSGGLQPLLHARQVSGSPSGTPTLNIRSVKIGYRQAQ